MDCSTRGFPALHHLPKSAQVHVHCIGDAIHPFHPLSASSSAFNLSQQQGLFQWLDSSHQVTNVLGHIISSFFPWWVTSRIPSGMLVKKKKKTKPSIFMYTHLLCTFLIWSIYSTQFSCNEIHNTLYCKFHTTNWFSLSAFTDFLLNSHILSQPVVAAD